MRGVQNGSGAGPAPHPCGQGGQAKSVTAPWPPAAPCTHLEIRIKRMLWGALASPLSKLGGSRLPEPSLAWPTLTDWPVGPALSKPLPHPCFSLPNIPSFSLCKHNGLLSPLSSLEWMSGPCSSYSVLLCPEGLLQVNNHRCGVYIPPTYSLCILGSLAVYLPGTTFLQPRSSLLGCWGPHPTH